MKKRLALILVLAAAVAAAVLVFSFRAPKLTPPPPVAVPVPEHHSPALTPREAVGVYLEALHKEDFRAAYEYLSADSREAHPYDEFAQLCGKSRGPTYDLASAQEHPAEDDRVTVTVPLAEDPARAGFTTVREDDGWKVVFIGGAPWQPYP